MWIKTSESLPPDEWFYLPGFQRVIVIFQKNGEGAPYVECFPQRSVSKSYFQFAVHYWQPAEDLPADVETLREEYFKKSHTPDPTMSGQQLRLFQTIVERDEKKCREEQEDFDLWVAAGKPDGGPYEFRKDFRAQQRREEYKKSKLGRLAQSKR